MKKVWNQKHFEIWDKILPPARPSISEMNIYTEEIHKLQSKLKRKLDVLILGSTIELRNWAYEENMNITIIDFDNDYYKSTCDSLKYKYLIENEKIIIKKWEEMIFDNEFDIIIGDSAIGNIPKEKLEEFIIKIGNALRNNGLYLEKAFLVPKKYNKKGFEEIVSEYNERYSFYNPFSYMIFDLVVSSLENNVANFEKIYNKLLILNKKGILSNEILSHFVGIKELGKLNFNIYVPTVNEY